MGNQVNCAAGCGCNGSPGKDGKNNNSDEVIYLSSHNMLKTYS